MLGRKKHGITETVCGLCLPPKMILRASVVKGEGWAGGKVGLEGKGGLEGRAGWRGRAGWMEGRAGGEGWAGGERGSLCSSSGCERADGESSVMSSSHMR